MTISAPEAAKNDAPLRIRREWYLPDAAAESFDSAGNGGPTLWVDGRIVGAWAQTPDGEIRTHYFERVAADRRREIDEREARLAKLRRTMQLGRSSREDSSVSGRRSLLRRVQSGLESDEALVEFFFLGRKLQAFVVHENGIRWVRDIAGRVRTAAALMHTKSSEDTVHA